MVARAARRWNRLCDIHLGAGDHIKFDVPLDVAVNPDRAMFLAGRVPLVFPVTADPVRADSPTRRSIELVGAMLRMPELVYAYLRIVDGLFASSLLLARLETMVRRHLVLDLR